MLPRLFSVTALLLASTAALDQTLYGINYDLRQGADWDPSKCKPAATIAADLKVLATITKNVRTYSLADCDVAPVLTAAKSLGLTVWLGVWVSADSSVYDAEVASLKKLIKANLIDDNVVGFNVGSEAVYRKDITAEQSIKYLKDFKSVLSDNKISTPVSITDIVDVLTAYPDMVAASDVVTANQFPFWEKIEADKAVAQFKTRFAPLVKLAAGKEVVISETGWPTAGVSSNASAATPEAAGRYLNDFYLLAKEQGWKYYYFAGFDTPYKAVQAQEPDTVESYFGIFGTDGKMKTAYDTLVITKYESTSSEAGSSTGTAGTTTSGSSTSTTTSGTTTSSSSKNSDGTTTSGGDTDSASPGTVHAGTSTSNSTSAVSKSNSSVSDANAQNANGSSRLAASLTACLAIASAVLMSL
uniref:glucan endo-1,3-beta-D-glucosidase n=1 Tax=Globisporangium ultimum (strain ATCC 200006 / CBS 805.95 / DAOM BR144) TaxID=431595 RepID=K3WG37_GLOUD